MEVLIVRVPDDFFGNEDSMSHLQEQLSFMGLVAFIVPKSFDIIKVKSLFDEDAFIKEVEDIEEYYYYEKEEPKTGDNDFDNFFKSLNNSVKDAFDNFNIKDRDNNNL
ncbi:MAG: hypothetical protein ACLFPS_09505 [Clostridia bacterium]